jgi:hypothetical protein
MNTRIWIYTGLVVALCVGLLIAAIKLSIRNRRSLRTNLAGIAKEMQLQPAFVPNSYYGQILGWPVLLELTNVAAFAPGSSLHSVLSTLGFLSLATGDLLGAAQMRSMKNSTKLVIILTIDGTHRPRELDALVSAINWEPDGWKLAIAGDQKIRWVQDPTSHDTVQGVDPLSLLARTLGVEPSARAT